ncbi:hypothetical protein M405DRAFT_16654 [Rhizopogon salebrosus TDB-379]|nr:hypothetical protein M405DRAFT_16654 [Rhizopogon salebrosus TDB-379]
MVGRERCSDQSHHDIDRANTARPGPRESKQSVEASMEYTMTRNNCVEFRCSKTCHKALEPRPASNAHQDVTHAAQSTRFFFSSLFACISLLTKSYNITLRPPKTRMPPSKLSSSPLVLGRPTKFGPPKYICNIPSNIFAGIWPEDLRLTASSPALIYII